MIHRRVVHVLLVGFVAAGATLTHLAPAPAAASDPFSQAAALVGQMSFSEEVALVHADGSRNTPGLARLGVPAMPFTNGPGGVTNGLAGRGATTRLPAPIVAAASFDPAVAAMYGNVIGTEAKAQGYSLVEGPDVNMPRVPEGGRTFEMYSEDPYLSGQMAATSIQAVQSLGVLANVKHYVANDQETNRANLQTTVDQRTLRELYLAPFETAVKQGQVASVMCAYPLVNGTYSCGNRPLETDILKNQWGFQGFIMSDFYATHGVGDAVAGLDMESPTGNVFSGINTSNVPKVRLDDMLIRRLGEMIKLGQFQTPVKMGSFNAAADGAAARQVEEDSMVLLKNSNNLLPLNTAAIHKIALIGPGVSGDPFGGGSGSVENPTYVVSPAQGIHNLAPGVTVTTDSGANAQAVAAAADVAVVLVDNQMAEGGDLGTLSLGGEDSIVTNALAGNPHTIVVVETGTAALMPWESQVPAILWAGYPGQEVGNALADIIFGKTNPSGKLSMTFPSSDSQEARPSSPVTYAEKLDMGYRGMDANNLNPLFPFGFGLSYTTFGYSNLQVSSTGSAGAPGATVAFDLTNTGTVAGAEAPQVYVGFPSSAGEPPKQLRGFSKLTLQPGQTQHVSIALDSRSFQWWDTAGNSWVDDANNPYSIMVGSGSRDIRLNGQLSIGVQTSPSPTPPSCGTPINNLLTANGGGTATFTWMPVGEGCTAFALYIYSPSGARLVETLNSNSLAVTGLNPNNWYTFTIIGWNGSRWVAWANYAPWVQVT